MILLCYTFYASIISHGVILVPVSVPKPKRPAAIQSCLCSVFGGAGVVRVVAFGVR